MLLIPAGTLIENICGTNSDFNIIHYGLHMKVTLQTLRHYDAIMKQSRAPI